jgi:hypothetical protein
MLDLLAILQDLHLLESDEPPRIMPSSTGRNASILSSVSPPTFSLLAQLAIPACMKG